MMQEEKEEPDQKRVKRVRALLDSDDEDFMVAASRESDEEKEVRDEEKSDDQGEKDGENEDNVDTEDQTRTKIENVMETELPELSSDEEELDQRRVKRVRALLDSDDEDFLAAASRDSEGEKEVQDQEKSADEGEGDGENLEKKEGEDEDNENPEDQPRTKIEKVVEAELPELSSDEDEQDRRRSKAG